MILKLAAKHDPEPQVFRAMPADVTPRILYECDGSHGKTQYHCWITERAIPLDEFVRDPAANKQQCTLGAFMCLLRAALHGLRLSDCAFFNFGVRCNDSAVVIIDAGGYGINSNQQWSKGDINRMIMTKFWRQAEKEQAANPQLRQLWQQHHQLQECLDAAEALWAEQPKLQHATESMHDTADLLAAREEREILQNQSTGAGKLVALVGKYQCNGEWSFAHTRACWKAALRLHAQLGQAQSGVVDELYSRLTTNKSNRDADDATEHVGYEKHSEEHIRNVIGFWIQLREIRKKCHRPEHIVEDGLWYCWNDIFWWDLTEKQKRHTSNHHSIRGAMLHKAAGWTYAAKAILLDGLPELAHNYDEDDPTKHIRATAQFAEEMAEWLHDFSTRLLKLRASDESRQARQASKLKRPRC